MYLTNPILMLPPGVLMISTFGSNVTKKGWGELLQFYKRSAAMVTSIDKCAQ